MKNWVRVFAVMLAIGAAFCIGGAAANGTLYGNFRHGRLFPIWGSDDVIRPVGSGRGASVWNGTRHIDSDIGDMSNWLGKLDEITEITELREMDFSLGAGNYQIVEGDGFGLQYDGDWIESNIEDGVWKICTEWVWTNAFRDDDRTCIIYVPTGCVVDKLNWSIGAASVEVLAPITANTANLEIGAGNLEFDRLDVHKKINTEIGAGNLELNLTGGWSDYTIDADVAMGSILVNDETLVGGLAGTCSKGSGPRKIKASLGMGCIDIHTDDQ